jgi:2-dehydropantoate 2-reductase
MLEYPETLRLIEALVSEGAAAARMRAWSVETGKMWDHVRSVLEKTASNRTSMLQDIENGRRTEVDAIVGPLIKAARVKGEMPAQA